MRKIVFNPRYEKAKIVVIGEKASWESVAQGIGSQEEPTGVERRSHQWDMKGMMVIQYNVSGMAGLKRKD